MDKKNVTAIYYPPLLMYPGLMSALKKFYPPHSMKLPKKSVMRRQMIHLANAAYVAGDISEDIYLNTLEKLFGRA